MQREPRKEEQPTEPRKEVTERKRRFQIVKLEERIAPGHSHTDFYHCGPTAKHCKP